MKAYLQALRPEDIFGLIRLKPQQAGNIVGRALKSLKKNHDGTLDGSHPSDTDRKVLSAVCSRYTVSSVYDADRIFSEFVHAVVRNGYASDADIRSASTLVSARLSVFAFSVLHRSSCRLFQSEATLAGQIGAPRDRTLSINATFPFDGSVPQLRIGFDVFRTQLIADQHCTPELIAKAQHANGLPENPAQWDVPIEVGADWLLREMQ